MGGNNVPWHAHTCCHVRRVGGWGGVGGNNVPWRWTSMFFRGWWSDLVSAI